MVQVKDTGFASTFKAGTQLKAKYANSFANTSNIDVVEAVCLSGDNEVDFGASTATTSHALFGFVTNIDKNGYCTVMTDGVVEGVVTDAAIAIQVKTLAMNDEGVVESVISTDSDWIVIKAATSADKTITVLK